MPGSQGVDFVVANTDAQALSMTKADRIIQLGVAVTEGLGAGSQPEVGRAAAEECIDEIIDHLYGTHMCFVTAGMGGGTGTGAAPVVAAAARNKGILTVGVVTKPFHFEGQRRMRIADSGIEELQKCVDTLIVIPNQNLFRIANDKTTFADAFGMADQVLYSGVACITDLMVKEGLINLDFADVRSVMREMGRAMMGTGEASGEGRAMAAAEAAIANPLLDETSMKGAQGLLISITGGRDMTLFEVDEAATRIREEVDPDANIILGATFDEELEGLIRVSVVATGIDREAAEYEHRSAELRQMARPASRSTAMPSRPAAPAPTPAHAPAAAVKKADPIADAIRAGRSGAGSRRCGAGPGGKGSGARAGRRIPAPQPSVRCTEACRRRPLALRLPGRNIRSSRRSRARARAEPAACPMSRISRRSCAPRWSGEVRTGCRASPGRTWRDGPVQEDHQLSRPPGRRQRSGRGCAAGGPRASGTAAAAAVAGGERLCAAPRDAREDQGRAVPPVRQSQEDDSWKFRPSSAGRRSDRGSRL